MDIIVVSSRQGQTRRFSLQWRSLWLWLPLGMLMTGLLSAAGMVGYWMADSGPSTLPSNLVTAWAGQVAEQRAALEQTRGNAAEDARALARRLARMQAHMMRLEAAGARLTEVAGLDEGEFDFASAPALGGPEGATQSTETPTYADVFESLDTFERQLSDRERQLRVLEDLLLASRLQQELRPSGWPVEAGWISSLFGVRTDPFTGRRAMHEGMDFAAREGSDIYSVGAGIVSHSGTRSGYGKIVEINHGNGYVTRYSHNKTNLVKTGDRVYKGQRLAQVGNSGRSTGPHLHFEVLYNGRVVNPQKYIQAAR
ncbi:M23 family metallopeptidase [Flagellatimonas centrodinii]|uniref:M23 family metallopeptidase n=1 Tax=Flagellatimonas centrodinii TaxID=2806210 RepID=UPI001FEFBD9A|nr:M23 family metallopeptidase [Flagellatimonas centrodinii]ULQ47094.1 M23 family metallopeptidase [Flagellatimonas centrodinii]